MSGIPPVTVVSIHLSHTPSTNVQEKLKATDPSAPTDTHPEQINLKLSEQITNDLDHNC